MKLPRLVAVTWTDEQAAANWQIGWFLTTSDIYRSPRDPCQIDEPFVRHIYTHPTISPAHHFVIRLSLSLPRWISPNPFTPTSSFERKIPPLCSILWNFHFTVRYASLRKKDVHSTFVIEIFRSSVFRFRRLAWSFSFWVL